MIFRRSGGRKPISVVTAIVTMACKYNNDSKHVLLVYKEATKCIVEGWVGHAWKVLDDMIAGFRNLFNIPLQVGPCMTETLTNAAIRGMES